MTCWDTPQDPLERARARILADQEYLRVALDNIRAGSDRACPPA